MLRTRAPCNLDTETTSYHSLPVIAGGVSAGVVTSGIPCRCPCLWSALSAWLARSCWLGAGSLKALQAGPACVATALPEVSAVFWEVKPRLSALTSGRRCIELSRRCGVCSCEAASGCGARTGLWLGCSPGEAVALAPDPIMLASSRSPAQGSHRRPVRSDRSNSWAHSAGSTTFSSQLFAFLGELCSHLLH